MLVVAALGVASCSTGSDTTTTAPAPTSTAAATTTTAAATTTTTNTTLLPTTTTTIPEDRKAFVGWWKATDADGSHLDLRVRADGTFMYWDSASGVCQVQGHAHSPETWAGTAMFLEGETPTMTASGTRTCFPYGGEATEIGENAADFLHDQETDMLKFSLDGVRYERSPAPPAAGDAHPLVGSWEATDSDGTRITVEIALDGSWISEDTRSGGCENMGLSYATWSASGTGMFALEETPSFEGVGTTLCRPAGGGDPVPRTEGGLFTFEYREETDEAALLLFHETLFTRVRGGPYTPYPGS